MNKKITCGPENIKEFRTLLKETVPEFFELVKTFYQEGMIDGLRGCKLEIGPQVKKIEKTSTQPKINTHTCRECSNWVKDSIGDVTAAGTCVISAMPRLIKWPNTPACDEYKEQI